MDHVLDALNERLGGLFGGRRVVLAGGSRLSRRVQELSHLGVQQTLVLCAEDVPPLHNPQVARWFSLGITTGLVAAEQRRLEHALTNPSAEIRALLDDYDPTGEALVISTPYVTVPKFAGRPVLNQRRPEWVAVENKTTIDALWDELSVPRAPVVVADVDEVKLWAASELLDRGAGVVWSGDARGGINGGANFVRRVRSELEAAEAFRVLAGKCDQIRVMPFLEGIPCSIHGMVFPDGTAVLRPIEMVVPRRSGSARFLYAGCASYYDPPVEIRDQMRNLARHVGGTLRSSIDYRGTFTVDGVVTGDGFLPTEVNTRYGGAMACLEDALPQLPLALVQVALVAGHDLGVSSMEFEETLLAAADARRSGGISANTKSVRPVSAEERPVIFAEWACRWAHEDETPHGRLLIKPGPIGGKLELDLDPAVVPVGRPVAPLAVAAFALADQEWGTGFGPLEPAIAVGVSEEPTVEAPVEAAVIA